VTVVVAAASRHGATAEIASTVGAVLQDRGVPAVVVPIEEVETLDGYDAVVLGSAVYMGRWLEPARRFAAEHATELAARPTWLFSSGPVGEPAKPPAEDAVDVSEIERATRARGHRVFPGRIARSSLGLAERAVVGALRVPDGDYRDWDAVAAFAQEVADAVG
jgi:menaquinone-dependent protoporphyrinogen oxidase